MFCFELTLSCKGVGIFKENQSEMGQDANSYLNSEGNNLILSMVNGIFASTFFLKKNPKYLSSTHVSSFSNNHLIMHGMIIIHITKLCASNYRIWVYIEEKEESKGAIENFSYGFKEGNLHLTATTTIEPCFWKNSEKNPPQL